MNCQQQYLPAKLIKKIAITSPPGFALIFRPPFNLWICVATGSFVV